MVQLYVSDMQATVPVPIKALKGFKRIRLKPGEKQTMIFTLEPDAFSLIDANNQRVVEPGEFAIMVGWNSGEGVTGKITVMD